MWMGELLLTALKIVAGLAALTTMLIALFAVTAGILGIVNKARRGKEMGKRPGRLEPPDRS
jgi:hypothetical protein